jgi:hypothetical protein
MPSDYGSERRLFIPARDSIRQCGAFASGIARPARYLLFLTNIFALPAMTINQLYRQHWPIELFFNRNSELPTYDVFPRPLHVLFAVPRRHSFSTPFNSQFPVPLGRGGL